MMFTRMFTGAFCFAPLCTFFWSYDPDAFSMEQAPCEEVRRARDEIARVQKQVQASIDSDQRIDPADMKFISDSFIPQYLAFTGRSLRSVTSPSQNESLRIVDCKVQGRGYTLLGSGDGIGWRSKKWWESQHPAALRAFIAGLDDTHPLFRGSKSVEVSLTDVRDESDVCELDEPPVKRSKVASGELSIRASKLHKAALLKAQSILQESDTKSDTPWHEHRNQQVHLLRWLGFPFENDVDVMLQTCAGQVWLEQQICLCDSP